MSARPQSSTSRILTVFMLVGFGALVWFVAPWFLPVYRWVNVDFAEISAKANANGYRVTADQVGKKYLVEFGYVPRGKGDPRPWVLLKMTPEYYSVVPDDDFSVDEEGLLLRATIINDRTGEQPSEFLRGAGQFKDRYFRAEAWRFPPKSLGLNTGDRPVILYDSMSLEKMSIGQAQHQQGLIDNTSLSIPDDDGWVPLPAE